MNEIEIWKDIDGYEGLYQVSTFGNVRRVKYKRFYNYFDGYYINKVYKMLTPHSRPYKVTLCKNGKHTQYRIHRLVAKTFIPNEQNLPEVNHKDENNLNNKVDNLEWCTRVYNQNYGTRIQRMRASLLRHYELKRKETEHA